MVQGWAGDFVVVRSYVTEDISKKRHDAQLLDQ